MVSPARAGMAWSAGEGRKFSERFDLGEWAASHGKAKGYVVAQRGPGPRPVRGDAPARAVPSHRA
jgi:hypothetical protein